MNPKKLLVAAAFGLFATPALAQESDSDGTAGVVTASVDGSSDSKSPWRGSRLSYENVMTTVSMKKDAELTWNPYYSHSLTLAPRYYFLEDFYAGLSWTIEQELTNSDWTNRERQMIWGDVYADLGWSGWQEEISGIRVNGSVRLALPASLQSQAQTQYVAIAPSVRLSRRFDLLEGLTVAWSGRWNQRFHKYTTSQFDGPVIMGCTDAGDSCDRLQNSGILNARADYSTGPTLTFSPIEDLTFSADLRFGQALLYDSADVLSVRDTQSGANLALQDVDTRFSGRYNSFFSLSGGYSIVDELSIAAGVSTPSPQLDLEGQRRSPFFNRYTQVFVSLDVDLDALGARF